MCLIGLLCFKENPPDVWHAPWYSNFQSTRSSPVKEALLNGILN